MLFDLPSETSKIVPGCSKSWSKPVNFCFSFSSSPFFLIVHKHKTPTKIVLGCVVNHGVSLTLLGWIFSLSTNTENSHVKHTTQTHLLPVQREVQHELDGPSSTCDRSVEGVC